MVNGLIGRKLGMTQLFIEDRDLVAATVIEAGPCFVVQKRTTEKDGYAAIQLGFEETKPQRVTKPMLGHFKKAGTPPLSILKEFSGDPEEVELGDVIGADIFSVGDVVDVSGKSKGKGFSGTMKRHNFSGQPESHGGMAHRRPGSIGQASDPARVWKGIKMPGRMGAEKVSAQGLQVINVDTDRNLVIVKGSVPGPNGGVLFIRHTSKGKEKDAAA